MFGTRLIQAAHTLTIKDPLMKENIKDFTRQCFAWPYVFSNIAPGKKAALETGDMLGFIEQNPHPLLGIYWREGGGSSKFLNCRECVPKVREAMKIEVETGITSLAQTLFGAHVRPELTSQRLAQYFGDAWGKLAKGANDYSSIVQQELMLNAYRESIQDKREEFGLGRTDMQMAHLNAARGMALQEQSFLVKAVMSGTWVPILHTILFAFATILFAIVSPLTFLPNGVNRVMLWIKVMLYLATWPVLFAILNCIGQMFAVQSMETSLVGYGDGLTLLTQTGMADIAHTAYLAVIGMQLSIPFLAWTLLNGGGHAFSQMASSFTQGADSFAGKAGAEMVDGNVAFDTQSLHTRSVANTQLAQQQVGPSMSYGMRMDDGKLATLYGAGGQTTIQEHQTNLGTNVSQNDAVSTMFALQGQEAAQSSLNFSKQSGKQFQEGVSDLLSVGKTYSDNKTWTDTFGSTDSGEAQKSLNHAMDTVKRFAKDHNISEEKSATILAQASVSGGFSGKLFGSITGNTSATWDTSAKDAELISKAQSSGVAKTFAENFSRGIQHIEDHKGSINDSSQLQKLDQAQQNFSESKHSSEQAAASLNKYKMYSKTAAEQHNKSLSSNDNMNDQILYYIGDKKFGGISEANKQAAAGWKVQNPEAYLQEVGHFLEDRRSGLTMGTPISREHVDQHYAESQKQIEPIGSRKQAIDNRVTTQSKQLDQQDQELQHRIFDGALGTQEAMQGITNQITHGDIQKSIMDNEGQFKKSQEEWLITKAARKGLKG